MKKTYDNKTLKHLIELREAENDVKIEPTSSFSNLMKSHGNMLFSQNERLNKFIETHNLTDKYSAKELYRWHTLLTLSCQNGKNKFFEEHGYDLDKDEATLPEFFDAVANEYGGEIIQYIKQKMEKKEARERKIIEFKEKISKLKRNKE